MASEQADYIPRSELLEIHKVLYFKDGKISQCICGHNPSRFFGNGTDQGIIEDSMLDHFKSMGLMKGDM